MPDVPPILKPVVLPVVAQRGRVSAWIGVGVALVSATMMHPTFASLVAISLVVILLVVMRWIAHIEGRYRG